MTDSVKLTAIIAKARVIRNAQNVTPAEYALCDLVEALAIELRAHVHDTSHVRVIGTNPYPLDPMSTSHRPDGTSIDYLRGTPLAQKDMEP